MSIAEKQSTTLKPIYDPRRAIEHMQTLQGTMPIRLFAILFPLWDVETTATQEEGRPYELMEKYVERGIDEGRLHTVEELASFFGLQSEMVKKILNFLDYDWTRHLHWQAMGSHASGTKIGERGDKVRFKGEAHKTLF